MLTVSEKIQVGQVSTYLAFSDVEKGSIYGARLDPRLPVMLAMETDAVRWWYNLDNNDSTLLATSNYLISLCGKYALTAIAIVNAGGGGGTVNPVVPSGYVYTALSFTATAVPTLNEPTDGSFTFQSNVFIGGLQFAYVIVNGIFETIEAGEVTFNSITGTITRLNPYVTGDIMVVPFLRKL
jgi:hypothetical protein